MVIGLPSDPFGGCVGVDVALGVAVGVGIGVLTTIVGVAVGTGVGVAGIHAVKDPRIRIRYKRIYFLARFCVFLGAVID